MDSFEPPSLQTLVLIGFAAFVLFACCGACMSPFVFMGVPRGGVRIRR